MSGSRLAVESLRFQYSSKGEELFDGLSCAFPDGAMTALTGESGRGKSTLLYIIGLLLTPTAGHVSLDGEDVSSLPDAARSRIRAHDIGFVFQDSELDPTRTILDSVLEPSMYAGSDVTESKDRALALLAEFGLDHRANHRPGEISGGQAQRVAVCRSLINSPSVLLADEPTGNLDRGNAQLVLESLSQAAHGGRTVLIATHDPFVLEFCDERVKL